jgi:S-DNA-T family DNA segregation ATPase FtsK/SpoIIIE
MVSVAGRHVSPDTEIGAPPLLHGAIVDIDDPTVASVTEVRPLLELHVVAGPDAGAVVPAGGTGRHVVGRAHGCAVRSRTTTCPGALRAA